eukprot:TRINITY_DN167_c0_g1_i1.p1 TRINITY_DN167_c0_g1~~TRINITY_DN167_c0_g1_i1.p1  ORF type:complete len:406 (+),score=180.11 TRINITY_DN167_c0_g1_i1:68-1219(+)
MTSPLKVLSKLQLGDLEVSNRIALAPLTRARASDDHTPTEVMVEYYRQRATAGLVISEGAGISQQGMGWYCAPGIWSEKQVAGWKPIVEAVHQRGGTFAMQLWHMGRQVHSDVTGQHPVAPSAVKIPGEVTALRAEKKEYQTPEPLTVEQIKAIVQDYKKAAQNAKDAGCDMVELHSANGYLLDLFLQSKTNKRTDDYGGSVENKTRLLREVLDAVETVYPAHRIGVRLSPNGTYGDMGSADNVEVFTAAIKLLGEHKVGYVHLLDGVAFGFHKLHDRFSLRQARDILESTAGAGRTRLMGNCGYTRATAEEAIQSGDADMIGFGRAYISNPDLPERFAQNVDGEPPLNPDSDMKYWWTFGFGAQGYTDFPTLEDEAGKVGSS